MPVFQAHEADSAEMIAKREVGRFRQVKSKTDACQSHELLVDALPSPGTVDHARS